MGQVNTDLPKETIETVVAQTEGIGNDEFTVVDSKPTIEDDFMTLMVEENSETDKDAASGRIAHAATELLVALAYSRKTDKITAVLNDAGNGRRWNLTLEAAPLEETEQEEEK